MITACFDTHSPATQGGDMLDIQEFGEHPNNREDSVIFFVVYVTRPIQGSGSLNVRVQQSNSFDEDFESIVGLNLTVDANTRKPIYYVGIRNKKYLKAVKTVNGNITDGSIAAYLDTEKPRFARKDIISELSKDMIDEIMNK